MLQEFLQYLATVRRFSPLTVQNYRRDVTNFLEWLDVPEADFDPRRITVEDVREWIVHRTETKHLGAASMNRELSSLRSFFRYLHRTGRIDKEVMYRIHALKTSRRIPAFVPSTRMEGILDELDRESESPEFKFVRNSLIVLLFYSCGLRLAELVGIDRDDFSGDYTALKVRGKGDKERIVPILPPVREKILHYLDEIDRQGICISKEKSTIFKSARKTNLPQHRLSDRTEPIATGRRSGQKESARTPAHLRHRIAQQRRRHEGDTRIARTCVPAGDAGLYAQQHRQVAEDLFQSSPAREKRSGANKTTELIGRSTVPQITNLIKHSIMNVQIQSVKFDADRKLVEFVEHKMDKLDRFVERAIGADVILKLDKDHELGNKVATINLHIPGDDLVAESRGKSFEEAVDLSIEALKRQIDKYKGRLEK